MFDRLKVLTAIVAASLFAVGGLAQTPAAAPAHKPAVKDQGEYDIANAAAKEKDPQKQLALLRQWEQKYPDSDFKGQRSVQIASAEGQIATKGEQAGATPADQEAAQKAAEDLVANLDKYLAPENKPATASDAQWKQAKDTLEVQSHTVLATLAMGKKTPDGDATAEKEYKKVLELSPSNASIAYTLGTLILREQKVERYPEALFYIARAIQITGPQALTPQGKQAADAFLKKAYEGYHGDDSGLDDVKKVATTASVMPANFTIASVTQVANKKAADDAAFAAANPDVALWRTLRTALTAPDGDNYFTSSAKDTEFPGGANGVMMFRAKVVSQPMPNELLVTVDNPMGDATLKFDSPLKGTVDAGTEFMFKGVIDSFQKDPYMLTLTADKDDISGLPATLFAPAAKPRRRAVKKK